MDSPNFPRRVLLILITVLALMAILLCGFVWKHYLFAFEPTPGPVAVTTIPTTTAETLPTVSFTQTPIAGSGLPDVSQPEATPVFGSLVPGMYVAYDQDQFEGNNLDYAAGSHLFVAWRLIEDGPRGAYDWSFIDSALDKLAPGKKAILRIVTRCPDVDGPEGMRDACAPNWTLNADPIIVENPPCEAPTRRMNYLDPVVQQGLVDMIHALGDRYRDDERISAVEIAIGYGGEPVPWPHSPTICDYAEQKTAYLARPEYASSGKAWAEYHKEIITAYVEAFQVKKPLTTIINAAYAERYHADVVRHAVKNGVGLALTSLHSDYNANRGSADYVCYWGFITEPGFDNDSEMAQGAYLTQWAPLVVNRGRVPIGFEYNNRYDNTGRIPPEGEAFTRWAMLNALDKGATYVLAFNDGKGFTGNIRYPDVWRFFNRYAGRDATSTPDVWIAFRSPWKEGAWCPDIYDYSWHLTSELETLPYADAESQQKANMIDAATGAFDIGPKSDWRHYYARTTADIWPVFNLDVDDAFLFDAPTPVEVAVTYFDHSKGGKWTLYYDSATGEKLAGTVTLTGSNTWKIQTFRLDDARFANGLKPFSPDSRASGFDLRLDRADDVDDIFSMVQVIPAFPPSSPEEQSIRLQQGLDGFQGFSDTYLSEWQPNQDFHEKTVLALRIDNVMTSLLKVDLSRIPPGSRILEATLHFARVDPRDPTVWVNAYELLRDWDKNATYNRASKNVRWQKPGALGSRDARTTPLNPTPVSVPKGGAATFDLTELVQKWVNDPDQNRGIILRAKSNANKQYSFGSSDARKLALRPYLDIRFIPGGSAPAPTPTPAPTSTPIPPTPTPTLPPTLPPTATPAPPTATPTSTSIPPTQPPTNTPLPTATSTPTRVPPPTNTPTPAPSPTPVPTATPTPPAECTITLRQNIAVGPHPKGVAAWPKGFLTGLFDDGSLAVFDGDNVSRVATSDQGANDVAYRHGRAYLIHRNSANVSVVDPARGQVEAVISVGELPWGAAANDSRLFVANFADNTATIVDLTTNQPIATTAIHGMPALAAAGAQAGYITHLDGYVSVIGNDGALRGTFGPLPGGEAFGVALDEARNQLFVSNRRTKKVLVLDSRSGEVIRQLDVAPSVPYALAFSPQTGLLFAVDAEANRLLSIDAETGEIIARTPVNAQNARHGGQFLALSSDGSRVYVPAFDAGVVDVFEVAGCRN